MIGDPLNGSMDGFLPSKRSLKSSISINNSMMIKKWNKKIEKREKPSRRREFLWKNHDRIAKLSALPVQDHFRSSGFERSWSKMVLVLLLDRLHKCIHSIDDVTWMETDAAVAHLQDRAAGSPGRIAFIYSVFGACCCCWPSSHWSITSSEGFFAILASQGSIMKTAQRGSLDWGRSGSFFLVFTNCLGLLKRSIGSSGLAGILRDS